MTDRDFILRPIRKEPLKNVPTDSSMELTDSIHHTTAAHGQVGHVEGLITVVAIPPPQRQKIVNRYMRQLRDIRRMGTNQFERKLVERRFDGRMGRKHIEIGRASCRERVE